jgi:rubrerythrin
MNADTPSEGAKGPAIPVIRTAGDLLVRALEMEIEAAERYHEFAAQMELHSNLEVASLFRKLAGIELKHAETLARHLAARGIAATADAPALGAVRQEGLETSTGGTLHYLMTPYHALEIALENERRAFEFFSRLTEPTVAAEIRGLAQDFAHEEETHVALIREWLARTPEPPEDWAYDPDEPRMPD